jgi:hypothetical protein
MAETDRLVTKAAFGLFKIMFGAMLKAGVVFR